MFNITEDEIVARIAAIKLRLAYEEAADQLAEEGMYRSDMTVEEYNELLLGRVEQININDCPVGYAASILYLNPSYLRETAIEEIADKKALAEAKAVGKDPGTLMQKWMHDTSMGEAEYTPEENREAEQELRAAMDKYRVQEAHANIATPFTAEALDNAIVKIKARAGQPMEFVAIGLAEIENMETVVTGHDADLGNAGLKEDNPL